MDDINVNYKEMYLKMVRASEQALEFLIHAQQECEDIYISSYGKGLTPAKKSNFCKKTVDKSMFYK